MYSYTVNRFYQQISKGPGSNAVMLDDMIFLNYTLPYIHL